MSKYNNNAPALSLGSSTVNIIWHTVQGKGQTPTATAIGLPFRPPSPTGPATFSLVCLTVLRVRPRPRPPAFAALCAGPGGRLVKTPKSCRRPSMHACSPSFRSLLSHSSHLIQPNTQSLLFHRLSTADRIDEAVVCTGSHTQARRILATKIASTVLEPPT